MTYSARDSLGRILTIGSPPSPPMWKSGTDPRIEQIRGVLKAVPCQVHGNGKGPEAAALAAIRLILEEEA